MTRLGWKLVLMGASTAAQADLLPSPAAITQRGVLALVRCSQRESLGEIRR